MFSLRDKRRNFLKLAGVWIFGFLGYKSAKATENPKDLPVLLFKDSEMVNHKEIMENVPLNKSKYSWYSCEATAKVWVNKENAVLLPSRVAINYNPELIYGEMELLKLVHNTTSERYDLYRVSVIAESKEIVPSKNYRYEHWAVNKGGLNARTT